MSVTVRLDEVCVIVMGQAPSGDAKTTTGRTVRGDTHDQRHAPGPVRRLLRVHREYGHKFPMFMTDLFEMMLALDVQRGTVAARWVVGKRGQNYGIRLAGGGA